MPHCLVLLLPSPLRPNQAPQVVGLMFSFEINFHNKKIQSFIHDGTKNIKSKKGDKLADWFLPCSSELNRGKYRGGLCKKMGYT